MLPCETEECISWYSLEKDGGMQLLPTLEHCESHPGTCGLSSAPVMTAWVPFLIFHSLVSSPGSCALYFQN